MRKCYWCEKLTSNKLYCSEKCRIKRRKSSIRWRLKRNKDRPWEKHLEYIRTRCGRFALYKKVKNYLTVADIKRLWFKNKAYELKHPCIHRVKEKHYTTTNCKFIERQENGSAPGEEHSRAKMTNKQVINARKNFPLDKKKRAIYIKQLVKKYNYLAISPIRNMLKGTTWKLLPYKCNRTYKIT